MKIREIQEEILRLKKENDICILAHAYQNQEILEIADYVGDSYSLSVQAAENPHGNIVMCGVRFMAETCKVLSPEKTVRLPNPMAGCPMADQLDPEMLAALKQEYPGYAVVAYINTSLELKTVCDVCVTSSSAVKICKAMDEDRILFIPDQNLGQYVAGKIPEKTFAFYSGGCPRHFTVQDFEVRQARAAHPNALFLVHPECRPSVTAQADYMGSTTGIMDFVRKSDAKEFIIGTENSIVEHLQFECPEKEFYPVSVNLSCMNMRVTTLMDVWYCVCGRGGEEVTLSEEVLTGARRCIDRMIELGG